MADPDLPPGVEYKNYLASSPTPEPTRIPRPATTPVPATPPSSFRDTSTSFEERMRRNQLPETSSTPFLDRAKTLQERAQAGVKSLIGEPPPVPTPVPTNPNVLAARTGTLDQVVNAAQNQSTAATPIPTPSPLTPIKPGAQPNSFIGPKLNTTPATIPTADKLPSLIDARFASKQGTEYPK